MSFISRQITAGNGDSLNAGECEPACATGLVPSVALSPSQGFAKTQTTPHTQAFFASRVNMF